MTPTRQGHLVVSGLGFGLRGVYGVDQGPDDRPRRLHSGVPDPGLVGRRRPAMEVGFVGRNGDLQRHHAGVQTRRAGGLRAGLPRPVGHDRPIGVGWGRPGRWRVAWGFLGPSYTGLFCAVAG